jgi:hypothetical protein
MFKEMPVIPVNKVTDLKKKNREKWRAEEEEERHKRSLNPLPPQKKLTSVTTISKQKRIP